MNVKIFYENEEDGAVKVDVLIRPLHGDEQSDHRYEIHAPSMTQSRETAIAIIHMYYGDKRYAGMKGGET